MADAASIPLGALWVLVGVLLVRRDVGRLGWLAVAAGCEVVATVRNPDLRDAVATFGATAVYPEGFGDHGPFDVVLELVGAPNLAADVKALRTGGRIAVIGPAADTPRALLGCYSYPVHVLPRHPEFGLGVEVPSILDAVRAEFPQATITFERGADFLDGALDGLEAARVAAAHADVVVLAVGDLPGMFGRGTSGEGCDIAELSLPGGQAALALFNAAGCDRFPDASSATTSNVYAVPHESPDWADEVEATVAVFVPVRYTS